MKKIAVLKFGGTSMGTADSIKDSAAVIIERVKEGKTPFVVVSAISKMTDILLNMLQLAKNKKKKEFNEVFKAIKQRHYDIIESLTTNISQQEKYKKIIDNRFDYLYNIFNGIILIGEYNEKLHAEVASSGEFISSYLMELCLIEQGIKAEQVNSKNLIRTEGGYLSADANFKQTKRQFKKLSSKLEKGIVFVMSGFYGANSNREIQLMGRGASDFSASIVGVSINACIVEIWTDANGIMSADPRIIKNAVSWKVLSRGIASEIARAGAKVLHPKTIVATYYGIEVVIRNVFDKSNPGTLIKSENNDDGVKGLIADGVYSIVHLENEDMFSNVGFIAKMGIIADKNNIQIDMVATSEASVSFTIKSSLLTKSTLKEFNDISNVKISDNVTKISIIGGNITSGDALAKTFEALSKNKIEVLMSSIGNTKNNIGIVVAEENKNKALEVLHNVLIV
ncbi:MAG: aspartate kinase [Rickettsiales bacterium]|jgi:aspartate kinase|nr:aspartate kinase [Rickettsiales bacterium]